MIRLYLVGALIGVVTLTATHLIAYGIGVENTNDKWKTRLASDKTRILEDGKDITNEVLSSDDNALCDLLGGC